MAIDHNFKVKKGLDVLGGDVNLGDGFAYKIDGTTVVDSSRNLSNISTIASGAITSSGTITAPTLIAGAYGAGGSAGDGFRINSTDIYGQIDSVDKIHISAVTGHINVQSGNTVGKFAVKSTGVHASYDFYNNGTSYFNGTTEVNAEFKISSSSSYITHFNYQDNGVNIISQANGGSTSIRNNNGNLFTLSSTGSLSVAQNVIAGNSSTAAIVRAHYNDGSYMTLEGYGLVMNRGASYIRPSTDGDKTLYIGNADASLDWASIRFRSTAGLYLNGTQFIDASRNLLNIASLDLPTSGSKITLNAYSTTSQEGGGIFFRDGFDTSNKYNLSIIARSRSNDGSTDGLSINGYEGVAFSTGSNTYNERLYLHTTAAFTVPITTTSTISSGVISAEGTSGGENLSYASNFAASGASIQLTLERTSNSTGWGGIGADATYCFSAWGGSGGVARRFGIGQSGNADLIGGGYQINGTTVIDSSRNLTNIGTISSGAITASNSTASTTLLTLGSSAQTSYTLAEWKTSSHGTTEAYIIAYGASHSSEAGNFAIKNLEASGEIFFELASSVRPLRLTSTGATFAGTISSGAITSSSTGQFTNLGVGVAPTSSRGLKVYHTANFEAAEITTNAGGSLIRYTDSTSTSIEIGIQGGKPVIRTSNLARLTVDGANVRINSGDLQMASTTVIDSSRNLTNIGTISSGVITATGEGHTFYNSSNSIKFGRNANENIQIIVTDGSNKIVATQDSDANGDHDFILDRVFNASTGASNFYIRNAGSNQLSIDKFANVTIAGNLTVQGTTTTINTANLNVEDKNITLNYSSGDSSSSANGAGITIQDAVSSTTDASMTWNAASDVFQFSHGATFGTGTIDPDSFSGTSGGFGNIADGGGWSARGIYVHGGGTGDAAAIAHNGSRLYFGIQDGSTTNSMATWLDVQPNKQTTFSAQINTVSHGNSSQWYTAYNWGNHASAGYITGVTAGAGLTGGGSSGAVTVAMDWTTSDTFTGTYGIVWNASNVPYTASWLQVRGSDDTLLTRNISATGTITASGNVQHTGLTMTSGTDIDQLYTVTDSLTLTTSYQDTSINSTELSTGTYIMQLFINGDHSVGGSHYTEYYSGVISWYGASTNSSEVDEIVLHRAGHAPNSSVIHLRTQRHPSGGDNLVLQIKANYTMTAARNYVFKFRRMI